MKYVKSSMIQCCVWGLLLDFGLTFATIPYVLFPTLSGYPLGILFDFGMSMKYQTIVIIELMIGVGCSLSGILENRFSCMSKPGSSFKNHIIIYIFNMIYSNCILYVQFLKSPEQESARKIVLYEMLPPNLPEYIHTAPIYVASLDSFENGMTMMAMYMFIFLQCAFFAFGTVYKLYFQHKSKNLSSNTKRMQNKFFVLICIQCSIPVIVISFPMCYIIFSCSMFYFNQAINNLVFILFSFHGSLTTISIIFVHPPYRKAITPSCMRTQIQRSITMKVSSIVNF
ncbi:unnamed protein product [Caenorhabditis angaria]|uniref:Serpentine Receptor, class H n=1 Tax=Caenorhabditis angaria TaxID=860376 RepID=A0A9P1NAF5_9PELO|nr:unnamed protein product [Caenorhabditis angaria]